MAEPTLYLFDGYNMLHAGEFEDPRELVDRLASFVALNGARGVVVFDGVGEERTHGPLEVRYAAHADALLERLAAENRGRETVCLVSSDTAVRGASGQEVQKRSSAAFLGEMEATVHREGRPRHLRDQRLDGRALRQHGLDPGRDRGHAGRRGADHEGVPGRHPERSGDRVRHHRVDPADAHGAERHHRQPFLLLAA